MATVIEYLHPTSIKDAGSWIGNLWNIDEVQGPGDSPSCAGSNEYMYTTTGSDDLQLYVSDPQYGYTKLKSTTLWAYGYATVSGKDLKYGFETSIPSDYMHVATSGKSGSTTADYAVEDLDDMWICIRSQTVSSGDLRLCCAWVELEWTVEEEKYIPTLTY